MARRATALLAAAAVALAFAAGAPRDAAAKPMSITLAGLRTAAVTVVIARLVGPAPDRGVIVVPGGPPPAAGTFRDAPRYRLEVERTLRGSAKPGPYDVLRSPDGMPSVPVGERVLAFVDGDGRWRWAGTLALGTRLEDGLLRLAGFYDWNAYLVSPALLTLPQLEKFLAGGGLEWSFTGKLHFPAKGAGAPVASAIALSFRVSGDAGRGAAKIDGMPALAGFTTTPEVSVSPGWDPDVTVVWSPTSERPLEIDGKIVGVDAATGRLEAVFWLDEPEVLTEPLFRTYVASRKLGAPWYELVAVLDDGTRWTLRLGEHTGRVGTIARPGGETVEISGVTTSPERNLTAETAGGGHLQIDLAAADPALKLIEHTGAVGELLQELLARPIGCTLRVSGGTKPVEPTRGRLELVKIDFTRP